MAGGKDKTQPRAPGEADKRYGGIAGFFQDIF
jgi:hypothetical protein